MSDLYAAKKSDDVLEYLKKRRSVLVRNLAPPGPSEKELKELITIGCRVPDHGKLSPFYFIIVNEKNRDPLANILREAYKHENPDADRTLLEEESKRFERAPTVLFVVSRIRKCTIPVWEQLLCAGAACQNIVLGANAMGYGAQWLTEWYAYNQAFKAALGLEEGRDHVAGVIYIGTPVEVPRERARPNIGDLINIYGAEGNLNKGDAYDRPDKDLPESKFSFLLEN